MPTTNKTQSQRVGTALPSDLLSERSTSATIDGIQRPGFAREDPPVRSGSRVCAHCGAKIDAGDGGTLRPREFILNCVCGVLLIAVVLCVGYLLNSSAERGFDNLFDHWVWHEPLNDWNL